MEAGVRLTVVPSEGEAEAICGLLRVNGIVCSRREAGHVEMLGGWWYEVLVGPSQLDAARELIAKPPP